MSFVSITTRCLLVAALMTLPLSADAQRGPPAQTTGPMTIIDKGVTIPLLGTIQPRVPTTAALKAVQASFSRMRRDGHTAAGDGGAADYTWSAANCASADDAAEIQPTNRTGCWQLDQGLPLTPQMFGATCNDTDSTVAVQRMVNAAIRLGRAVRPMGNCVIRLTSTVTVAGRLDLVAAGAQITNGGNTAAVDPQSIGPGFWFHLAHTGQGFKFQPAAGITPQNFNNGNRVWGVGTYRDQPIPSGTANTAYTPCDCDYDWAFYNTEADLDLVTLNSSRHIYGSKADRIHIRNAKGQPLITGIFIEAAYDTPTIDDVHYWSFWSNNRNVLTYMNNNATGIRLGRADNAVIKKAFLYGYGKCLHITQYAGGPDGSYPGGTLFNGQFSTIDCDASAQAVVVDSSAVNGFFTISSLVAYSSGLDFPGSTFDTVSILANGFTLSIGDASMAFPGTSHVYIGGQGSKVQIGTLYADKWNTGNSSGNPAGLRAPGANSQILVGVYNFSPGGAAMTLPLLGENALLNTINTRPLNVAANLDVSGATPYSLANGANVALPAGSGTILVRDSAYGNTCLFLHSGGATALVSGSSSCATSSASGKISLSWNGSAYILTNNLGGSTNLYSLRTRVAPFN